MMRDLLKIPSSWRWIEQRQAQFARWINDKDSSTGQRKARLADLVFVKHIQLDCQLAPLIVNDWIRECYFFYKKNNLIYVLYHIVNLADVYILAYALISSIHAKWEVTLSHDSAIGFTWRRSNSGYSCATRANSVVQTGVKSAGCENSMPHLIKKRKIKIAY